MAMHKTEASSLIQDKFFTLLRFSIGVCRTAPSLDFTELKHLYELAKQQSLLAILFDGLKRIEEGKIQIKQSEADAYEDFIMQWTGKTMVIARRNDKTNKSLNELFIQLEKQGFDCCLLKGQGNALHYPHPEKRTSGDIDVWLRPAHHTENLFRTDLKDQKVLSHAKTVSREENIDGEIRQVISFVRKHNPAVRAIYHHIDYPAYNGIEVEVHYRPHFMHNIVHNARLQRYFLNHADEQFAHKVMIGEREIAVPTRNFNIVFQLSHIYQHLFHEGIGLRQILDYYYVLRSKTKEELAMSNDLLAQELSRLGLKKIGGAICWILVNYFGMEKRLCIVAPDERRGKFVLGEILAGGNFGQYDERYSFAKNSVGRNLQRLRRDARLFRLFPSEAIAEPFFRLYHAWWRWRHN